MYAAWVCVCVHAYACAWMCQRIRETDRVMSAALISSQPSSSNGTLKPFINVTNTSVPCDTTNDTMYYEDTFTGPPTPPTTQLIPQYHSMLKKSTTSSWSVFWLMCSVTVMSLAVSQSKLCILSICYFNGS